MAKKNLSAIPSGISADELAEDLAQPKQPMNIDDTTDDGDFGDIGDDIDDEGRINKGSTSGPSPGDSPGGILHNHENSTDNAELITFLITLIVAFVLAKLVDIDGDMKEYEFDADQQRKIEKGFEIWFNSFENDFKLPVFLSWVAPLGMAIYDKTDKALDNRKAKKAAMRPQMAASIRQHPAAYQYQGPPPTPPPPPPAKPPEQPAPARTQTGKPGPDTTPDIKAEEKPRSDEQKKDEKPKKAGPGRPKGSKDKVKRKSPARKKDSEK